MSYRYSMLAVAAALAAGPASAASDADIAEIRAQIQELKRNYEARIQALESRLKEAEARPAPAPTPPASSSSSGLAAFNPAISAILGGQYANLSQDPKQFRLQGFLPSGDIGPGRRGFTLNESELALSANVDHKFSGNLIFSISPDNKVEVEEAYGIFTAAPAGFTPKFGRFLSAQGYLNEQHAHAWDFVDAPLAYQAFFGGQYTTDGVQVKWIAPTEHFIEIGGELGNGDSFPGTSRNKNGAASGVLFAHTGGDIGDSHSWLAGLSYLATRAEDRAGVGVDRFGNDAPLAFTGRSRVAIASFVWKYAPHGNPREKNFKLQGEYFWRRENGDLTFGSDDFLTSALTSRYSANQGGMYLQGVYQFMPTWRVGLRYDRLNPGAVDYGDNAALLANTGFHPQRGTAMIDWSPSEFSRIRLQYAHAKTVEGLGDNEWFLQYILSLGAHGAHKY